MGSSDAATPGLDLPYQPEQAMFGRSTRRRARSNHGQTRCALLHGTFVSLFAEIKLRRVLVVQR